MRYHWGLGVGHVYAHNQGPSQRIPQNQATEAGEHEQENEGRYSFPDLSEEGSGDKDGHDLDRDLVNDSDGGSDSGSFQSTDNDVDDDILDYQN